ncbi:hypothetical protein OEZ86_007561 [Tetradesmus obliquus]|nr:hypothetical protein OEZ86_007561 [Tetradesmus obliquus]
MTATAKLRHSLLDSLQQHKGLRQTTALFVKNVLVAWRNRWATAIRLLAPLLFLALALIVQVVMAANSRRTGRIRDTPFSSLSDISSIPDCSDELFIYNKPCLDFVYTPNNDTTVKAIVDAMMRNNQPPIPAERVMGFGSRFEADTFIQGRSKYVMGAVHFHQGPSGQLQYVLQTNTSAPAFKGYVQSPNEFFQMPFIHLTMLVTEKETGLRQALQTMGLQQGSYWLSWWLFEAVMAGITAWCITGFGVALRLAMFVHNDVWLMFVLFWLFGMAMASFTCCVSVFLQTSQSASNAGLGIVLVGWICQALGCYGLPFAPSIYFTKNGMGKVFFWIFAMFPWNPLTKGVLDMSAAAADATRGGLHFAERASYCGKEPPNTGYGIVPVVLDPGVLQEEQRMKTAWYSDADGAWSSKQDMVQTTSINCLIGALPPSGGDIRVMGHSLLAPGGLEVAQAVMGVCPQFDVLWDELSGREHMYIYGCIKGLPSKEVTEQGSRLLEQVQLTPAAGKRSSSYSGGMKRRLSVALALLGGPQLVFLDEPSTGMDPISRRAVWDAINAAKQHAAVVLTTHSMEEADALGDRIGIMVRGRMRVLGGSLTLKQKYGNGYQLRMRLKDNATLSPEAEHLGLTPVEEGRGMLHYVIPQALAPQLQVLLELLDMPDKQQQLGLAEVHVSLASLEEVFLTVVKQAEQDHAALHGHTVVVELPETGQQLEVPVGQEAAVDPATGDVYAVEWVQDEWGKLAVLGVRLMEQAEQQRYWQNRHVQH